jgi:hypothetical protein
MDMSCAVFVEVPVNIKPATALARPPNCSCTAPMRIVNESEINALWASCTNKTFMPLLKDRLSVVGNENDGLIFDIGGVDRSIHTP